MNEIERLRDKILEKYPDAEFEMSNFKNGMKWLDVWIEDSDKEERVRWSILEWNSPTHSGFGFTDMSDPDDDRHLWNSQMEEYELDFDTVFGKVCEVLAKK